MVDAVSSESSTAPAGSMPVPRLRLAVFLIIAGFMITGPVAEQIFGMRTVFWRSWTMFSGIGLGVIDVSFTARQPDGTSQPVDRFATLAERRDGKLRRVETLDELTATVARLCAALGPGADLRVKARQATREGWRILRTEEQNVCGG